MRERKDNEHRGGEEKGHRACGRGRRTNRRRGRECHEEKSNFPVELKKEHTQRESGAKKKSVLKKKQAKIGRGAFEHPCVCMCVSVNVCKCVHSPQTPGECLVARPSFAVCSRWSHRPLFCPLTLSINFFSLSRSCFFLHILMPTHKYLAPSM